VASPKGRFPRFDKKHGRAFDAVAATPESLDALAGKLPSELLDQIRRDGWCGYHEGFLWTIDPSSHRALLQDWLPSTGDVYPFLRTALGGIFYMHDTKAHYLDAVVGDVSDVPRRMDILMDGALCDSRYLNDVLRLDLFDEALGRLGRLTRSECYGFLPPPAMGGPGTPETLGRVDLEVHLAMLATLMSNDPP
jgi:hypothetical protein